MSQTVHIRCGSDILARLDEAGLPGLKLSWADPLCDGPVPGGIDRASVRAVRADWLVRSVGFDGTTVPAKLAREDAAFDQATDAADEVVLWFEHDLYDQVILIHLLTRLGPTAAAGRRVSLVSIDRHPAVERFCGLGQLTAAQLAELYAARITVAPAAFALAARAWAAYVAPTPEPLVDLIGDDTAALPFLAAAVTRHLQQFPWRADGLALTEWLMLDVIDLAASHPAEVFWHVQSREPAPWLPDLLFFAWLARLSAGPEPLVDLSEPPPPAAQLIAAGATDPPPAATRTFWPWRAEARLTERGRAVLLGRADALAGRPLDRWLGGVHLTGETPRWRWDAVAERLCRATDFP